MRLGIDFGTTRTLVAFVDRGNYPLASFDDLDGDTHEYIPTVVALEGDNLVCGWRAAASPSPVARSFKRILARPNTTANTPVPFGHETRPLGEVLRAFAAHVVAELGESELEAIVGVPASAGSAQRLLTLDAFAQAGIRVVGLVNEPSAAAFEYTHRHARTLNTRRSHIVVYDLGGGTFDASLVRIDGVNHEILRTVGDAFLGGDDFDERLARLATEVPSAALPDGALVAARLAKERILPQSRRAFVELDDEVRTVALDDFYAASAPLVDETIAAVRTLLGTESGLSDTEIAGIYVVGGASGLPLIPRMLREQFGRRVYRSPHPAASCAIGLAIAADPTSGYALRERSAHGIGVFREANAGRTVSFDVLTSPDTAKDAAGEVRVQRRYRAAHNVGWFRFVEYTELDAAGEPTGDTRNLAEVRVPFDPALRARDDLAAVPVERRSDGPLVEETVVVDANGITTVTITDLADGFSVRVTA